MFLFFLFFQLKNYFEYQETQCRYFYEFSKSLCFIQLFYRGTKTFEKTICYIFYPQMFVCDRVLKTIFTNVIVKLIKFAEFRKYSKKRNNNMHVCLYLFSACDIDDNCNGNAHYVYGTMVVGCECLCNYGWWGPECEYQQSNI